MPAERWRKKPVVIDAVLWDESPEASETIHEWGQDGGRPVRFNDQTGTVLIDTLEGAMEGRPGDYIIRGVQGEIYPCKPEIFLATYERAETDLEAEHA